MSGVTRIRSVDAPVTYPAAATKTVRGGQLVEAVSGGVQAAEADSAKVLGVAVKDAFAAGVLTDQGTTGAGNFALDASVPGDRTTVEKGYFKVKYLSNAAFGDPLKAAGTGATAGAVTKATLPADAGLVVGSCNVVAGVTSGAVAEARILGNA